MNRRTLLIVLFFVCFIPIAVGILFWRFESLVEEKLQDYIKRLKEDGFTVEESRMANFNFSGVVPIYFFGDFRSFAKQKGISQIYLDREAETLFFLQKYDRQVEAIVFYYKKKFVFNSLSLFRGVSCLDLIGG